MEIDFIGEKNFDYIPRVGDYVQADYDNCLYFCCGEDTIMRMAFEDGSTGGCIKNVTYKLPYFKSGFRFVGRIDKFIF